MDPESGAAPAGSFISLSEQEQRYFSGLHGRCQADPAGTLSSGKVAELLKASQLPPEALRQVTELCGAKRLGYFGTPQFFVALKLVAAAQSGLPVHLESLSANLPLPRFVGLKNEPELLHTVAPPSIEGQGGTAGSAPWTSADRITCRHLETNADKKETRSPPRSPCCSPPHSPLTYRGRPYAKQRKGADAHNVYESKCPLWSMVQPDQHGSPDNYGTKAAAAMEHPALARTSSAERLDQQGPVDYADEDPWRITEEQLEYYTNQFKSLQPDLGALILGTIAKNFFTKSKLPIPELSHIWELSDVDRDGALTFPEFCTAFHLIVARKNGYVLPECLPPTLRPGFALPEADGLEAQRPEPLIVFEDADLMRPCHLNRCIVELQAATKPDLKEETGKTDVKKETMTQQKRTLRLGAFTDRPEPPPQDLDPNMRTKTRPRSYSSTSVEDAMKKAEEPPTPPPRPQKTHSRASSLDLNKLFQQGAPGLKSGWLPPPPALPPRPTTAQVPHFINVSEKKVQKPNFADFSHFREEEESMKPEEEPGPRTHFGPSNEDPVNTSKQGAIGVSHSQVPQKPVRRKYHPESQNPEASPPPAMPYSTPTKAAPKLPSKQKRAIQTAIRKNKESNAVLTRLNSELQQQLKVSPSSRLSADATTPVVHQERVTLEMQLDLLRPLAST